MFGRSTPAGTPVNDYTPILAEAVVGANVGSGAINPLPEIVIAAEWP
jgi:hypothetical protein